MPGADALANDSPALRSVTGVVERMAGSPLPDRHRRRRAAMTSPWTRSCRTFSAKSTTAQVRACDATASTPRLDASISTASGDRRLLRALARLVDQSNASSILDVAGVCRRAARIVRRHRRRRPPMPSARCCPLGRTGRPIEVHRHRPLVRVLDLYDAASSVVSVASASMLARILGPRHVLARARRAALRRAIVSSESGPPGSCRRGRGGWARACRTSRGRLG